MINIHQLLNMNIDWLKSTESDYIFIAKVEGTLFKLRLNDFPEEPLCTLIWENEEQDLDDLGKWWTLPKHRGE